MHTDVFVTYLETAALLIGIMGILTMATCPTECQCNQEFYVYCQNGDIDEARLKQIVGNISHNAVLLDLSSNRLKTVPAGTFSKLYRLRILNLQSNRIHAISNGAFDGLANLVTLILSNNSLHSTSQTQWTGLRSLQELHLTSNYIDILEPKAFLQLSNLTRLYLNRNNVGVIENNTFLGLRSLELLDLSRNVIHAISSGCFMDLQKLRRLELSYNELRSFDGAIFHGLVRLYYLHLDYNYLVDISNISWSALQDRLKTLTATHNQIVTLQHNHFYGFRNLRKLKLGHNRISDFPGSSMNGQFFEEVSLTSNDIRHINRDMFSQAKKIVKLDLSGNKISSMDTGSFDNFKDSVLVLNLDGNSLQSLHAGMFRGMTFLKILNLANNSIRKIDKGSLSDLVQLQELALSRNRLTEVNPDMLGNRLPSTLYLNCNPLEKFVGFEFSPSSGPIKVYMNLTVNLESPNWAVVHWPYQQGSQIYWTLSVKCLSGKSCSLEQRKDQYLPPYKKQCLVSGLSPLSKYYVCVRPVFVEDVTQQVHLEQCVFVYTGTLGVSGNTVSSMVTTTSGVVHCGSTLLVSFFVIFHILSVAYT